MKVRLICEPRIGYEMASLSFPAAKRNLLKTWAAKATSLHECLKMFKGVNLQLKACI